MPADLVKSLKEKELFQEKVWGTLPNRPLHITVRPISVNRCFLNGEATINCVSIILDFGDRTTEFPLTEIIPNINKPCPAIICINDSKEASQGVPNIEEAVRHGIAVFSFFYKDISENNGNLKSGISAFIASSRRKKLSPGKLIVWAWAALRVLECASQLDGIDKNSICVAGQGILGTAAMLAGVLDKRFKLIIAKDPLMAARDEHPHLFCPAFLREKQTSDIYKELISRCGERLVSSDIDYHKSLSLDLDFIKK